MYSNKAKKADEKEVERPVGQSSASFSGIRVSGAPIHSGDRMRQTAANLIGLYYHQLTEGCGEKDCANEFCASSPRFCLRDIDKNVAAAKALELFRCKNPLCNHLSLKGKVIQSVVSPTSGSKTEPASSCISTGKQKLDMQMSGTSGGAAALASCTTSSSFSSAGKKTEKQRKLDSVTEKYVNDVIGSCQSESSWRTLIRLIGSMFYNPELLMNSFLKEPTEALTKEDIRSMEVDEDKDQDDQEGMAPAAEGTESEDDTDNEETDMLYGLKDGDGVASTKPASSQNEGVTLDLESVRRVFGRLCLLPDTDFQSAFVNGLLNLSKTLETDLQAFNVLMANPNYINIFLIVMEIPSLDSIEFLESATPYFCKAFRLLPISCQAQLVRIWSTFPADRLRAMVRAIQQLITVRIISTSWTRSNIVNDDEPIAGAAKLMKVLYYASTVGGRLDAPELVAAEKILEKETEASIQELMQGAILHEPKERTPPKEDPLARWLGVRPIDCREPLVANEDFVNESLSDALEMDKDYTYYRAESSSKFTFMYHSFLLTTSVKNTGLFFDNRIRMMNERRSAMVQNILIQENLSPTYLRLRIRRDHVIDDALVNLEMIAMDNPQDLKKQLFVEFEGEMGIDEGGVSKEFFQLVVEEIFNPDIGMFTYDDETHTFWFNPTSFENDGQFTLIGIVLGLAIYNNVILDIHFPMVVYRKLLGKLGTFEDLKFSHPSLAAGLQDFLRYEGDVADAFEQPFCIGVKDVFGSAHTHNLKESGDQIIVTNETRKEFVDLYSDFLLNKSVEKQFRAFQRGFQMVTDESPIKMLFHPEEIELLVCGCKQFDFEALESATEYDGGYTKDTQVIRNFWEVIQEFTLEQKRQWLQFTTGSDRVPIGGLSKLRLIIARNGSDSDRLPTSHTCFNVLLLPEYRTKEKLLERLLKAITYSKGFGML